MESEISKMRTEFSSWESQLIGKSGEWEIEFLLWPEVYEVFRKVTNATVPTDLDDQEIEAMIFLLARDNEAEIVAEILLENESYLDFLGSRILRSGDDDAKWQYAKLLGKRGNRKAEETLVLLLADESEYVRRISLKALSEIKSERTEEFIEIAWKSNDLYQRIMVLTILKDIGSSQLGSYVLEARKDGREYLLKCLTELDLDKIESK